MGLFDGKEITFRAQVFYTSKKTRMKTMALQEGNPKAKGCDVVMRLQIRFPCHEKASSAELEATAMKAFNQLIGTTDEQDVEIQEVRIFRQIRVAGNPRTN